MIHYIIMELKLTIISNHYFLSVNDWFDYSGVYQHHQSKWISLIYFRCLWFAFLFCWTLFAQ